MMTLLSCVPGRRILLAAAIAIIAGTSAIGQEKTTDKTGIPLGPQIVQGDPINPEESGSVLILSNGLGCSGNLLTNEWAITAQHCGLDTAVPSNITVTMGSQSSVGIFAVGHPSLDFALVKIATPFRMQGSTTGFRMPLYTGATASLSGQVLRCRGYGCNTPGEACTGFGTLREAFLPVNKAPVDDYSFSVKANARGQTLAPGDSGSGAFARTGEGWALAGVLKGPDYGRPENWREWAMAYVNGTPIPIPEHWFIGGSHPTFLTPPLPNDYNDKWTWNPCPDGRQYSFTPTFDLESGKDFIALTTSSGAVTLTGAGMTKCTGQGPFAASIRTSHEKQSPGLLSMPIQCNYTGPSSVPPTTAPTTDMAPAVVGVGNNVYFLAKPSDRRIVYDRAEVGQAGLCWADVDGDGRTDAPPAAGAVGNHVFVAVKGLDGHLYLNQADLGRSFNNFWNLMADPILNLNDTCRRLAEELTALGNRDCSHIHDPEAQAECGRRKQELIRAKSEEQKRAGCLEPLRTDAAPAVTGVGNNVYFFARSLDGRIFKNQAVLGQGGQGWIEVEGGGRTDAAPAAGAVGTHVFVAVKGLDGHLYLNQADLGRPFNNFWNLMADPILNVNDTCRRLAEELTALGNRDCSHIHDPEAQAECGRRKQELIRAKIEEQKRAGCLDPHLDPLRTDVPPAIAGVGNNVYFFAKSLDGRIFYNRAVLGQGGQGWIEVEGGGRTDAAPAAGAVGTHVFVAVKGLDGHLYLNQADLGQPFGQWFPM